MKHFFLIATLGCTMQPHWLCSLNSTWFQGKTETEATAYARFHCRDAGKDVICREGAFVAHIPKAR